MKQVEKQNFFSICLMADERSRRIQSLATQIDLLSAELNTLLSVTVPDPPATPSSPRFKVGDRVQILNKYKGLLGHQGVVTRTGSVFIWFRLDSSNQITSRRHKNLRLLSSAQ